MKILFLPKYSINGASSRYRTYQYLEFFNKNDYVVAPLFDELYIDSLYKNISLSKLYIIKRYIMRFLLLLRSNKYDVIFLEKELFPYIPFIPFFFKLFNIKYIVDYDDAIFHNYDEHKHKIIRWLLRDKVPNVLKHAKAVITGSPYLTRFAEKHNSFVREIPTSIDIIKYKINTSFQSDKFVIGWIGTPSTSIHITEILEALKILKERKYIFELRLIGFYNKKIDFTGLPVKIIDWSEENEIEELNKFSVGIMPMEKTSFTKGKCAFKLIQYMAMAKPTISSPFEANIKVDKNNENFFADTTEEWVVAFERLILKDRLAKEVGLRNRKVIEDDYSIQNNKDKLISVIKAISVS